MSDALAVVLFWVPLAVLIYHWAVFPLMLALMGLVRRRSPQPRYADLPRVTVAIAAWNEELAIGTKLRNCLELDYPRDKLEIVVGTDAVTDSTNDIVRSFAGRGVRLLALDERVGKSAVINLLAQSATGDIILFTDADVLMERGALRAAVECFADPRVGMVLPAYRRVNEKGSAAEGLWDRYENRLKGLEGRLGVAAGVYGWAMFMRRSLFEPISHDTILDDYALGLIPVRRGYRVVFESGAVCLTRVEQPKVEFARKVRNSSGSVQQFIRSSYILLPKYGTAAWVYFSHKYVRWFGPFLLVAMLVGSALNAGSPFFRVALVLQVVVYASVPLVPGARGFWRKLMLPQYFAWTNVALLVGYWQYFFGKRLRYNWLRTRRESESR